MNAGQESLDVERKPQSVPLIASQRASVARYPCFVVLVLGLCLSNTVVKPAFLVTQLHTPPYISVALNSS